MLLGFLHATSGRATVLGHDIATRRGLNPSAVSGTCRAASRLYDTMTGDRLLDYLVATCTAAAAPGAPNWWTGWSSWRRPEAAGPRLLPRDAPEGRHHPGHPARPGAAILDEPTEGLDPLMQRVVLRHPRTSGAAPAAPSSSRPTSCRRSSACATGSPSSDAGRLVALETSMSCSRAAGATSRCGSMDRRQSSRASPGVTRRPPAGRPPHLPARGRRRARSWRPSPGSHDDRPDHRAGAPRGGVPGVLRRIGSPGTWPIERHVTIRQVRRGGLTDVLPVPINRDEPTDREGGE